jgi:hypothetical protein
MESSVGAELVVVLKYLLLVHFLSANKFDVGLFKSYIEKPAEAYGQLNEQCNFKYSSVTKVPGEYVRKESQLHSVGQILQLAHGVGQLFVVEADRRIRRLCLALRGRERLAGNLLQLEVSAAYENCRRARVRS